MQINKAKCLLRHETSFNWKRIKGHTREDKFIKTKPTIKDFIWIKRLKRRRV